jgi:TetR/AcrR family transcriptional regulator
MLLRMGAIRDAARTRRKIVEAAKAEFAARGFAGARIAEIARRAKLNKQLLYHYFASKEALFDEILEQTIYEREALTGSDERPDTMFRRRFVTALKEEQVWLRFLIWEAAEYPEKKRITRQARRELALKNQRNAIIAKQFHGTVPKDVKAELLQLTMYALANYPLAFPQITKMVTGLQATDPKFQAEWSAFLDRLGALLMAPAPARPSRGSGRTRRRP